MKGIYWRTLTFKKSVIYLIKVNYTSYNYTPCNSTWTCLQAVDFDENFETDEYVKHPINAFHLLQRTSQWLPKLKKVIPNLEVDVNFPTVTDAVFEASNGLADLLEHYDMKPSELVKGQIKSFVTGKIYPAKSKLTSNEIIRIANAAWKAQYYHGYVSWLEAALETAKGNFSHKTYVQ